MFFRNGKGQYFRNGAGLNCIDLRGAEGQASCCGVNLAFAALGCVVFLGWLFLAGCLWAGYLWAGYLWAGYFWAGCFWAGCLWAGYLWAGCFWLAVLGLAIFGLAFCAVCGSLVLGWVFEASVCGWLFFGRLFEGGCLRQMFQQFLKLRATGFDAARWALKVCFESALN